tara:strand:- start:1560 stop:1832 length:273 start_codon:yes stop_codon:yes gene_type:complete
MTWNIEYTMARKNISYILSKNLKQGRAVIDLDELLPPIHPSNKKKKADTNIPFGRIMCISISFGLLMGFSLVYTITRHHYMMLKMLKLKY